MLFEEHAGALGAVVPSPVSWIERLVAYRNDFTHHPVVDERTDLDKEELVQCNFVLRILLELCFLKAMAFESKDIERLAKACHRYRQIKARFFREA